MKKEQQAKRDFVQMDKDWALSMFKSIEKSIERIELQRREDINRLENDIKDEVRILSESIKDVEKKIDGLSETRIRMMAVTATAIILAGIIAFKGKLIALFS